MARRRTTLLALAGLTTGLVAAGGPGAASAEEPVPEKVPLAVGTETAEIGAATGVEFLPGGLLLAAAEPERRGGGSAGVVDELPGGAGAPDLAPDLGGNG